MRKQLFIHDFIKARFQRGQSGSVSGSLGGFGVFCLASCVMRGPKSSLSDSPRIGAVLKGSSREI